MSDQHERHGREPLPPSWFERNAQGIARAVVGVCVALVLADVAFEFLGHRHAHFPFEEWVGAYAAIGFASYVGLVMSAKLLRKLVMRPEDYYEHRPTPEPAPDPEPVAESATLVEPAALEKESDSDSDSPNAELDADSESESPAEFESPAAEDEDTEEEPR